MNDTKIFVEGSAKICWKKKKEKRKTEKKNDYKQIIKYVRYI